MRASTEATRAAVSGAAVEAMIDAMEEMEEVEVVDDEEELVEDATILAEATAATATAIAAVAREAVVASVMVGRLLPILFYSQRACVCMCEMDARGTRGG